MANTTAQGTTWSCNKRGNGVWPQIQGSLCTAVLIYMFITNWLHHIISCSEHLSFSKRRNDACSCMLIGSFCFRHDFTSSAFFWSDGFLFQKEQTGGHIWHTWKCRHHTVDNVGLFSLGFDTDWTRFSPRFSTKRCNLAIVAQGAAGWLPLTEQRLFQLSNATSKQFHKTSTFFRSLTMTCAYLFNLTGCLHSFIW